MAERTFRSLTHAIEAHYEELRRHLRDRTGSAALADDVIQEAWIRARTTAADMPANPRAYLYRLVGNLLVDHLRGDVRRAGIARGLLPEQTTRPDPAADAVVAARQTLAIVAEAVEALPERCRQVFQLYRGEGLTVRQIAGRLGTSEKTVEKQVARAMLECRRRLREAGLAP